MSGVSEENKNEGGDGKFESMLESTGLRGDEEKIAILKEYMQTEMQKQEAILKRYYSSWTPPPPDPKPPVAEPTLDFTSYFKENSEAINIMGLAETAKLMGYGDTVEVVTNGVQKYYESQRQIVKGIRKKFKDHGVREKKKVEEDDEHKGDNKQKRDLKQILKSAENSHIVDLLVKHSVDDVAQEYGLTNEELKFHVDEHSELLNSLEAMVLVERRKAKQLEGSSSRPNKKHAQGKKGKNKK